MSNNHEVPFIFDIALLDSFIIYLFLEALKNLDLDNSSGIAGQIVLYIGI
jgi:hypothetical protein